MVGQRDGGDAQAGEEGFTPRVGRSEAAEETELQQRIEGAEADEGRGAQGLER